jgi:hypothetical protein
MFISLQGVHSDEYGVDSQFDTFHDPSAGIKDEPVYNERTDTLKDSANQQQFDSAHYIQHADEIQSADDMYDIINHQQGTVEGAIDHQLYDQEIDFTLAAHIPDSYGDIRLYDKASDQIYNINEQEYAANKHHQYQSSVHIRDLVQSSANVHEQNVDFDGPVVPFSAFLNHTQLEEGSVIVTKCRMVCENYLNHAPMDLSYTLGPMTHFIHLYITCICIS